MPPHSDVLDLASLPLSRVEAEKERESLKRRISIAITNWRQDAANRACIYRIQSQNSFIMQLSLLQRLASTVGWGLQECCIVSDAIRLPHAAVPIVSVTIHFLSYNNTLTDCRATSFHFVVILIIQCNLYEINTKWWRSGSAQPASLLSPVWGRISSTASQAGSADPELQMSGSRTFYYQSLNGSTTACVSFLIWNSHICHYATQWCLSSTSKFGSILWNSNEEIVG